MNNNLELDNMLGEQGFHLEDEDYLIDNNCYPTDAYDFDSLSLDNRTWKSNVEDIDGGDNFADYCEYFFELFDEEEYFD